MNMSMQQQSRIIVFCHYLHTSFWCRRQWTTVLKSNNSLIHFTVFFSSDTAGYVTNWYTYNFGHLSVPPSNQRIQISPSRRQAITVSYLLHSSTLKQFIALQAWMEGELPKSIPCFWRVADNQAPLFETSNHKNHSRVFIVISSYD